MSASKTSELIPVNINVGLMGHVDSGKTSLAKYLSQIKSTAAFDKHPQAQERGITIDLGFSSLKVSLPEHLRTSCDGKNELQFTFVDCPGHSSLLRTVIGGSQIIDLIFLVVDITKGIQTQTAECLIIAEITRKRMVIVLNKADLIPEEKREATIKKVKKRMKAVLDGTPFKDSPIAVTSACPSDLEVSAFGMDELIKILTECSVVPERHPDKPFVFAVDHCFSIRGQGTVLTGTIIQGSVHVNDEIEIPCLKVQKKIKSMQMFRKNIDYAEQGDRLGICVKQLDHNQIERAIVCAPNYLSSLSAVIIDVKKIKYFKSDIKTGMKFHLSIGYENVLGKIVFFSSLDSNKSDVDFDIDKEYLYNDSVYDKDCEEDNKITLGKQFAVLEFERPVICISNGLVIGSKFEMERANNTCRLAFYGNVVYGFNEKNYSHSNLSLLKVFKIKEKFGIVERIVNEYEVIGKNIFKKDSNIERFIGFKVEFSSGDLGIIDRSFGKSGKVAIRIPNGLKDHLTVSGNKLSMIKLKQAVPNEQNNDNTSNKESVRFTMKFKKYYFDKNKKISQ